MKEKKTQPVNMVDYFSTEQMQKMKVIHKSSYTSSQFTVQQQDSDKKSGLDINNGQINNIKNVNNNGDKILIVGYSPTGGGHTARTLNIVQYALDKGTLSKGSTVYIHVPPHWEGTKARALVEKLANELAGADIQVRIAESDKPVYGYLDPHTGSSNDAKILSRIAMQPLRNNKITKGNDFLNQYVGQDASQQQNKIEKYTPGANINNLPKISASSLIEHVISINGYKKDNIYVLTDMDPALQKAAHKHGIPNEHRVDQQNHAILLNETDEKSNLILANAVLAKVLDARGASISHIALGGKNTLIEAWKTATKLGIDSNSTLNDRKSIINNIIFPFATSVDNTPHDIANGCVVKGQGVNSPNDIEKVVYIYAHKKTDIIAKHILTQLEIKNPDYNNKLFVFCGKNTTPGYNAMHLAYLADADGITTAGAGTSGEFVYLHREGGAKSNLLILPIENHNEQETIADTLYHDFPDYVLRMNPGERLESGRKIDDLISLNSTKHSGAETEPGRLMKAISASGSYVEQTHDILFSESNMDEQTVNFRNIEREMYSNKDMKATRHFLKLFMQLAAHLSMEEVHFPIKIHLKSGAHPAAVFNNETEINKLFSDNTEMKNLISMSSKEMVDQLPLFMEVKNLMTNSVFPPSIEDIKTLNEKMGQYMTTGF